MKGGREKMHRKTDSEETTNSMEQSSSSPNRSPSRRPLYYVQSPSNHDVEKMSYGSSPIGSPPHQNFHYYLSSPIHHSRESSTSRTYSASLKNPRNISSTSWKKLNQRNIHGDLDEEDEDDDDDGVYDSGRSFRMYFCFFLLFVLLFTMFSLILWGASKSFKPRVILKVTFSSHSCLFLTLLIFRAFSSPLINFNLFFMMIFILLDSFSLS
jgi:hypothetical protein